MNVTPPTTKHQNPLSVIFSHGTNFINAGRSLLFPNRSQMPNAPVAVVAPVSRADMKVSTPTVVPSLKKKVVKKK